MQVNEIMKTTVHCIREDQNLNEAAQILWERDCGSLPVLDAEGRLIGMLTDRDVCMAAYTQGRALGEIPVETAMSHAVHCCAPDGTIKAAVHMMREFQIRRVPVIDDSDRVVGILSLNDIALAYQRESGNKRAAIASADVADTLASICARDVEGVKAL